MNVTIVTKKHPEGETFWDSEAQIIHGFLIHRQLIEHDGRRDLYALTHVSTGYLIQPNLSMEEAEWWAHALTPSAWIFENPKAPPETAAEDYRRVLALWDCEEDAEQNGAPLRCPDLTG